MLFSITLTSGCATYVRDRLADAGDIFTATIGSGLGVTAKAGPIHTGLGCGMDLYGLRGGEFGSFVPKHHGGTPSEDMALLLFGVGMFGPDLPRARARGKLFASAYFADSKKLPVPDHRDWTNSYHVVVHVHATPAQARQDLFNAVDDAMSNLGKTSRKDSGFPGEICFSAESGRHLFFARDCIMVSIHDYSYGREGHALQLARALDAQILEALRCVGG